MAATLQLSPASPADDPHHGAIPRRHTDRSRYLRDRPVSPAEREALLAQVRERDVDLVLVGADEPLGRRLQELTPRATARILGTPQLLASRNRWLRLTAAEAIALRDGSDASRTAGGIADRDVATRRANDEWLETTRDVHCATAAAWGLILARGDRRDHRLHLEAGRLWQRVHLEATVRGVAMQPMNHVVELIDHELATGQPPSTREALGLPRDRDGWQLLFPFRLGHSEKPAPPSMRRRLADVLVT